MHTLDSLDVLHEKVISSLLSDLVLEFLMSEDPTVLTYNCTRLGAYVIDRKSNPYTCEIA